MKNLGKHILQMPHMVLIKAEDLNKNGLNTIFQNKFWVIRFFMCWNAYHSYLVFICPQNFSLQRFELENFDSSQLAFSYQKWSICLIIFDCDLVVSPYFLVNFQNYIVTLFLFFLPCLPKFINLGKCRSNF